MKKKGLKRFLLALGGGILGFLGYKAYKKKSKKYFSVEGRRNF